MQTGETLSIQDIHAFSDTSVRALQLRAVKEKWPYIEMPGRGRGGKVRRYDKHKKIVGFFPGELFKPIRTGFLRFQFIRMDFSDLVCK